MSVTSPILHRTRPPVPLPAISPADPTPCAGLDVSAVTRHVIDGSRFFAGLLSGADPIAGRAGDVANTAGDGLAETFRAAAAQMRAAFAADGVLERTYTAPIGTASGATADRLAAFLGRSPSWPG